jgi:hypothetical protein
MRRCGVVDGVGRRYVVDDHPAPSEGIGCTGRVTVVDEPSPPSDGGNGVRCGRAGIEGGRSC